KKIGYGLGRAAVRFAAQHPVAAGVAAAALAMAKLVSVIEHATERQVESQRRFAGYSGELAGAYARYDVRGMVRDINYARATGGTTSELLRSHAQFEDMLNEWRIAATNGKNLALAFGEGFVTPALKVATLPVKGFNW